MLSPVFHQRYGDDLERETPGQRNRSWSAEFCKSNGQNLTSNSLLPAFVLQLQSIGDSLCEVAILD